MSGVDQNLVEASKLHLGCFDQPIRGWVNTDITPHIWVARVPDLAALLFRLGKITQQRFEQHKKGLFRNVSYLDVRKPFPYKHDTFDAVFSSHLLEHLYPRESEVFVEEIHRALKPGGTCRLVIPDLDKLVAGYDPNDTQPFLKRVFQSDGRSKNSHHWHYNFASSRRLLKSKNFRETHQCAYPEGACPDLEFLDNRPDESLFVEATK